MTRLPRPLAWEAMAIHGLTGILFALSLVILAANASLGHWWIVAMLMPIVIFSWLGWAYEAWAIWLATARLRSRQQGGGIEDKHDA